MAWALALGPIGLALGLAIGWLGARLRARAGELDLNREVATLEERIRQLQCLSAEKEVLLREAEGRLSEVFRMHSAEALAQNNQRFIELARGLFDRYREENESGFSQRAEAIQSWIKPLAESLGRFESKVERFEQERVQGQATLLEQLRSLSEVQLPQLSNETHELSRVLHQPMARGRWGEMQLRNLIEMAGMVDYCDFVEQPSTPTEEGRRRPDLIVRLPGGQQVVVDAKAPIEAYFQFLDSTGEAAERALHDHARQIRTHIDALAAKSYWQHFQPSPEFVVLFLPGEMLFSAALRADPGLIEYGFERKVIVANPTTLLSLLKVMAYGWRQEAMTRHAEEVAALARTLHDRASVLVQHWRGVGEGLGRVVRAYNESVASLDGRFLVTLRRFEDLGAAPPGSNLDAPAPVDASPRIPSALTDPPEEGPPR
jgi:DNA recombination protein RmuC